MLLERAEFTFQVLTIQYMMGIGEFHNTEIYDRKDDECLIKLMYWASTQEILSKHHECNFQYNQYELSRHIVAYCSSIFAERSCSLFFPSSLNFAVSSGPESSLFTFLLNCGFYTLDITFVEYSVLFT